VVGLGLGFTVRVRVRRPDSSGNLLLRRKLHYAQICASNFVKYGDLVDSKATDAMTKSAKVWVKL